MKRSLEELFLESELACEKATMYNKKSIVSFPFSKYRVPDMYKHEQK